MIHMQRSGASLRIGVPAQIGALDWLAARHAALSADHVTIWNFHEPSWREYRSSQWYVDRLRREGFEVSVAAR